MAGLVPSPEDRAYFLAVMRRPTNSAVHRRVNVPLSLDDGWSAARINSHGALSWPERRLIHREAERITSAAMIRLFTDLEARHPEAAVTGADWRAVRLLRRS